MINRDDSVDFFTLSMPQNMGRNKIVFQPLGRIGYVEDGTSIQKASRELRVNIEGLCGGTGTCGKCRVRVNEGFFAKYGINSELSNLSLFNEVEEKHINPRLKKQGYRLACQAKLHGDIVVTVPRESLRSDQVVRKAGVRQHQIETKPAVKQYSVSLPIATLDNPLADWERLQKEIQVQHGLARLVIDYPALTDLQTVTRRGNWNVTVSVWMNKEVIRVDPGAVENAYGIAVDIGTITIVLYLCELNTGKVVDIETMTNPQVAYGEDVMARISYCASNKNAFKSLRRVIIGGLNNLITRACTSAKIKPRDIIDATVVGNTCMHHCFLGIDPINLGISPFVPAIHHSIDVKAREIGIKISRGSYIHLLPIEAGFIGADNVAVLIAEEPYYQQKMKLIIDIGTNGELVLGNEKRLMSCSCATGPAFEGASIRYGVRAVPGAIEKIRIDTVTKEVYFNVIGKKRGQAVTENAGAIGICGSGIIDAVAQLYLAGIIDHTGRFIRKLDTSRLRIIDGDTEFVVAWKKETSIGKDIVICQQDIRNVQLAKAAMYAGAKIMMRKMGIKELDEVLLAGTFGSYISSESATILGLFPYCEHTHVYSIGNAAGEGAQIALLNVDKRVEAEEVARKIEYVELTTELDFNQIFARSMWLPPIISRKTTTLL